MSRVESENYHRVVRLSDPDRADIIAQITGRLPATEKTNRLNSVAEPTEINGHRFPSKKEAKRYTELQYCISAGDVRDLRLQVRYPLEVNGVPIFPRGYYADFVYFERQRDNTWLEIVEDAKGVRTDVYRIKAQLMLAIYGIIIRET